VASPSPLRPRPPLADRLNHNALAVAAVLMGLTVLTAVMVARPNRQARGNSAAELPSDAASPEPSRPSFLDEPVRTRRDTEALARPLLPSAAGDITPPSLTDTAAWARASGSAGAAASVAPAPSPTPSARARAYRAALASTALLGVTPAPRPAADSANHPDSAPVPGEEERLLSLGDSVLHAATRGGGGGGTGATVAAPPGAERHRAFLDATRGAQGGPAMAGLEPAGSPFTLRAGALIPALLMTGINSELPGDVVAQVSRDVYDSRTQRALLIPKGARLIGTYDNQVGAGEGRLLVAWTRLILPDGRSMRLPGLALKDLAGETGTAGQVDTHWQRVFGKALLLSAISAGVQLSQPRETIILATPSAGQVAAGALGQELSNVALEILRRGMDVAPTITVPPGQPFNVFLNGDLVFDAPYEEGPHRVP
jgi:type IV secretory pathway VirB10-like protein